MPHKCLNCGKIYEDGSDELIEGCECGSSLFLYQENMEDFEEEPEVKEDKNKVIEEIDNFLKGIKNKISPDSEAEFDIESIKVLQEGTYELDIDKFLNQEPLVIEVKDGSYRVHLASVFNKGEYEGFGPDELADSEQIKIEREED